MYVHTSRTLDRRMLDRRIPTTQQIDTMLLYRKGIIVRHLITTKNIKTVLAFLTEGGTIDCMVTGEKTLHRSTPGRPRSFVAVLIVEKIFVLP